MQPLFVADGRFNASPALTDWLLLANRYAVAMAHLGDESESRVLDSDQLFGYPHAIPGYSSFTHYGMLINRLEYLKTP